MRMIEQFGEAWDVYCWAPYYSGFSVKMKESRMPRTAQDLKTELAAKEQQRATLSTEIGQLYKDIAAVEENERGRKGRQALASKLRDIAIMLESDQAVITHDVPNGPASGVREIRAVASIGRSVGLPDFALTLQIR